MTYRMSCEQLHSLTIDELRALLMMAQQAVRSSRPCTAEYAEAVAAVKRIAKVIAERQARMRAFVPAPRRIRPPKPGR